MKNGKRWIAFVLAAMLCLPLCGCQELEDLRTQHAVWQEDGTILWNETVYRQLENVPDSFQHYTHMSIAVTAADVPVLLSDWFGEYWTVDSKGLMLHTWNYSGEEVYFCREDRYDEMAHYLQQKVELDTYYYEFWPQVDGETQEACYYLSDDEQAVIDTVLNYAAFVEVDDDFYNSFEEGEYSVVLGRCDGKHLFSEHYVVEIVSKREGFYLFVNEMLAAVPPEYNATMGNIVADYYKWEVAPYLSEY